MGKKAFPQKENTLVLFVILHFSETESRCTFRIRKRSGKTPRQYKESTECPRYYVTRNKMANPKNVMCVGRIYCIGLLFLANPTSREAQIQILAANISLQFLAAEHAHIFGRRSLNLNLDTSDSSWIDRTVEAEAETKIDWRISWCTSCALLRGGSGGEDYGDTISRGLEKIGERERERRNR